MLNSPFFDTTARLRHGTACRSRQTEEIYLRFHYIQIYVTRQWAIVPIRGERSCAYIPNLRCQISIFYRIMSHRNALRHMRNAHRRLPSRYENRKKNAARRTLPNAGTARTVKNAPASPCGCGPLHAAGAARAARNAFVANRAGRAARMQNEPPYPQ